MTTTAAAGAIDVTTANTTVTLWLLSYNINPIPVLQHWLVNHPSILNFSWTEGKTLGSSPQFLTITVIAYLSLTFFLSQNHLFSLESHLRRRITAIHNSFLIILSLIMAVGCTLSIFSQAPNVHYIICFPANTKPKGPIFFWAYIFYLSKILEYVDTLLILLNHKNFSRLSFLHVYHHATVVIMCYLGIHTSQSSLPLVIVTNCMVHVFMYFYYLLCALGFRPKWKRLVTECQILQFFSSFVIFSLIFGYHFGTHSGCSGIWGCVFSAGFIITLLYLFIDFHYKSYSSEKVNKIPGK